MSEYWYAPPGRELVQHVLLPAQRAAAAVSAPRRCCARAWPSCRPSTCLFGWSATDDRAGRRTACASRSPSEDWPSTRRCCEGDYVVGCDGGRSLVREQIGIDRGRRRLRPAHGAGRLPLAGAARGAQALSRSAPPTGCSTRTCRATGSSSAGSTSARGSSSTRRCRRTRRAENFDFLGLLQRGGRLRLRRRVRPRRLLGPAHRGRQQYRHGPRFIAGDAATATRPTAASA